jgi:hypothetical protein
MDFVKIINNDLKNNYENLIKLSDVNEFFCDGCCEKSLKYLFENKIELFSYAFSNEHFIYCKNCLDNKAYLNNLKPVDRLEYSTEDKPLDWQCSFCEKKLGGGCKWYCDATIDLDICTQCYNSDISKNFKLLTNTDNLYICERNELHPVLIERGEIKELKIPDLSDVNGIMDNDYILDWLNNIRNIVSVDRKINNIYYWLPFTDLYELPDFIDASTQLLVNCSPDGKGEVASVLYDNHYRIAINVVYDNFESYQMAFEKWEDTQLITRDKKKLISKLKKEYNETNNIDTVVLANTCKDFSGYVRLSKELKTYYG